MKIGNRNLFPLSLIGKTYAGYHIDEAGIVFSTKRSSTPQMMFGFGHGDMKYYTMNGMSVRGNELIFTAKKHPRFKLETATLSTHERLALEKAVEAETPVFVEAPFPSFPAQLANGGKKVTMRNHAPNVHAGISSKGVVIARVAKHDGVEHLLFGSKPAIHTTEASYRDEMTRLATEYPGTKFVACKITSSVISGGMKWE